VKNSPAKIPRLLLAVLATFALLPSASSAGVSVDYRQATDFSRYATYALADGTPARREMAQDRIVEAVRRELASDGLRLVQSNADLYVATHVLVDKHTLQELSKPDQWEFWTGITDVDAYDLGAGTLVIDFVDGESGQLVWRGLVTTDVRGIPSEKMKKIDKLVGKLLRQFPPASGARLSP
jgi:hypothetical protein